MCVYTFARADDDTRAGPQANDFSPTAAVVVAATTTTTFCGCGVLILLLLLLFCNHKFPLAALTIEHLCCVRACVLKKRRKREQREQRRNRERKDQKGLNKLQTLRGGNETERSDRQ